MYKKLLLSCLLALSTSSQALSPAPGHLTHAIAKILFYLPFLDVAGFISADIIEDTLFFEGLIDGEDSSIQIWKFNRNPDACFRIRLKLRTPAVVD